MANYNESILNGTKWSRCNTVTIVNPIEGTPCIIFGEQDALLVDGVTLPISTNKQCQAFFDQENGIIPLVHPVTGESLGTTTHAELYTILFSLYMQTAVARDEAEAAITSSIL